MSAFNIALPLLVCSCPMLSETAQCPPKLSHWCSCFWHELGQRSGTENIWRSSAVFIPFLFVFRPSEKGAFVILEDFPWCPWLGLKESWLVCLSIFFLIPLVFVSPDLDLCKISTRPLHSTSQLRTSPSISMSQVSNIWQALGQGGGYYKQKNHFTCIVFCASDVDPHYVCGQMTQVGVSASINQKSGEAVWKKCCW